MQLRMLQLGTEASTGDMTHYRTRSVVAREHQQIQRAVQHHPDFELIKGELTPTGLGVHLRWEYPEAGQSRRQYATTSSSPIHHLNLSSSPPSSVLGAPLSTTSSLSSISSALTKVSSADEEGEGDLQPQTPPTEDDLHKTGVSIHMPMGQARRLQRSPRLQAQPRYSWNDHPPNAQPGNVKRLEGDDRIRLEQLKRLEALKKARDRMWEEAEATGLFDASDEESEEEPADLGTEEVDIAPRRIIEGLERSSSSLGRTDTIWCAMKEPPSKLGPTLPKPILPYFRTESGHSLSTTSSTVTKTASATMSSISSTSLGSTTVPHTLSAPSTRPRCVRRYQEDGVWKTSGTFKDLPSLAHLAAFDSLQSLDDTSPPRSDLKRKSAARVETLRLQRRVFSISREATWIDEDAVN